MKSRPRTETSFLLQHLDARLALLVSGPDPQKRRDCELVLADCVNRASGAGVTLPLLELQRRFGLDELELDLLLLAAWPQVNPAARQRTLCLGELLETYWADPVDRVEASARLGQESPLRRYRLVDLWSVSPNLNEQVLQQHLLAPPRVGAYLLGQQELGSGLNQVATLVPADRHPPTTAWVEPEEAAVLQEMVGRWSDHGADRPLCLGLVGDPGSGKTRLCRTLASRAGLPVIEVACTMLDALDARTSVWAVREVYAAATLLGAAITLDRPDLLDPRSASLQALRGLLDETPVLTFLISARSLSGESGLGIRLVRQIFLGIPPEDQRASLWRACLQSEGRPVPEGSTLEGLATRFELLPAQVGNAARDLALSTDEEAGLAASKERPQPLVCHEVAAARQLRGDPGAVVRVRRVHLTFDDLILPEEESELVQEVLQACRHHFDLLHRWGFRERLPYGNGIVCLFAGEPGTGKTLCAQILASTLKQDLFQVSLPQILSKWVGDTEKQIAKVFQEAKASRAIMLFDEADSLLGSRTEVRTSADRYANMSTNYLLQEIEAFEGVVVLTTNLEENLDSAAARRILFRLRFPFPDAQQRAKLWSVLIPKRVRVAGSIDFEALGEQFVLSGGHIKNAVVRGAYEALSRGRPLGMDALTKAAVRECRALGKLVQDEVPVKREPVRGRNRGR